MSETRPGAADRRTPAGGNVLITSASGKVPLVRAVQNAARKLDPSIRVIAGDLDENALTRYVADDFWAMPHTDDASIDELAAGCSKRNIRTIIPTRDGELAFWAKHLSRFAEAGMEVIVSPAPSVEICLDKLAFARFGNSRGLPFIPADSSLDRLGGERFVVKERFGAASRSMGINLNYTTALEHGATLDRPIYQPFVAGREISVDGWLDAACKIKGLVLRSRDHVVNGESQITTTFRDARLTARCIEIFEALHLRGPVMLQALIDEHNGLHIIECNSRFGGASTASIAAGLDMFYWTLLERSGHDFSDCPFDRVSGEVRQVRTPADVLIHDSGF
jgi:carbamoyl-phosphate synthase large subunit